MRCPSALIGSHRTPSWGNRKNRTEFLSPTQWRHFQFSFACQLGFLQPYWWESLQKWILRFSSKVWPWSLHYYFKSCTFLLLHRQTLSSAYGALPDKLRCAVLCHAELKCAFGHLWHQQSCSPYTISFCAAWPLRMKTFFRRWYTCCLCQILVTQNL